MRTQPFRNQIQRLIPGGRFQLPVAAHQRTAQPLPAGHIRKAELALVARLPPVGRRIQLRHRADDPPLRVQFQINLAPYRAVVADGALHAGRLFPLALPFRKRADGADINAGAAELAARFQQRGAERCPHQRLAGAFRKADGAVAPHLLAGAHAPPAGDAQVVVPVVKGVAHFQRNVPVHIGHRRFQFHAQIAHGVLEFAALVFGTGNTAVVDGHMAQAHIGRPADFHPMAGEAAVGVLGDEHLHHGTAQLHHIGRFAPHDHTVGRRQRAGGGKAAPPVHRHHAHPARRIGLHPGVVAQIRHIHAGVNGGLQHHLAGLGCDFHPVYGDGNIVRHNGSGQGKAGWRKDGGMLICEPACQVSHYCRRLNPPSHPGTPG